MEKIYYKTKAINEDGIRGFVRIENGIEIPIDSAHSKKNDAANSEQLLALSFATCLNATIKYLLEKELLNLKSRVSVIVTLHVDKDHTYFFKVEAFIAIEKLSIEEIEKYLVEAKRRCPVSKLISNNEHVKIFAEKY